MTRSEWPDTRESHAGTVDAFADSDRAAETTLGDGDGDTIAGAATAVDDPLVGRMLGEFHIRQRIGQGGFGTVYRAVQAGLDRDSVLKVMHAREASSAGQLRFLREAKLASKLDHPYAAHIYAFGAEDDGVLWIAMELVRGTPLDRLLAAQGPMPLDRFLPLIERICEVVHTAHEQGIVHRDIKPANIMVLARAGRYLPKLLDFGIAKMIASATDQGEGQLASALEADASNPVDLGLTRRGAIMGSPLYMAPEQWMDAASVDARTDLYSLGVLAYECLVGSSPFAGPTLSAIAVAHATMPLPALGARFPPALDAVLRRAVAKEATERYASTIELASAFREASGISPEASTLPQLEDDIRSRMSSSAPHPIAEAMVALEAARNLHQGRDALFVLLRTVVRYIGLLALACRTRIGSGREGESPRIAELLRMLHRRGLTDEDWVELATEIASPFRDKRDAYPIPELVALHADAFEPLLKLHASAEGAADPLDVLTAGVPLMSTLLRALEWISEYTLAVSIADRYAERWMGVRRSQRATIAVAGHALSLGEAVLLDREHAPILSLSPLFQVAPPSEGAPPELFLFEGRGRRGAKLCAWPRPFEHHDETLWDWFRIQLGGTLDESGGDHVEERTPYLGLSPFSAADTAMYFGRESLVDSFVNRLLVSPFLAVVGRSGAGKSSFVHAGVVPALPSGWRSISLRPGPSPIAALTARLQHSSITAGDLSLSADALGDALRADAARRGPILLVVDQLEELFTLAHDPLERSAFAAAIVRAARSAEDPVRVVLTLRDDFLIRAEQLLPFRAQLGPNLQLVTVPAADDLLRILVEPARRSGYAFEDEQLPVEMVQAVADQPNALPLLSFTASKLWELRDRHFKQLTRSAYVSLGGVGGALAKHAEATTDAMPPDEQRLVRETFRHLVTSDQTRAVLSRDELLQVLGSSDGARRAIEKLLVARLLAVSDGEDGARVEIAHEALLTAWPRLVRWTHEDADSARMRDQLRAAARQWNERKRSRGLLWRGDALADYRRWRDRYRGSLTDAETAFVQASLADTIRGKRVRVASIGLAFVGLALAIVLLARSNARTQSKVAELYEEQGRQHLLAGDAVRASVYLVAAKREGARGSALDFLLGRAFAPLDRKVRELRGHETGLVSVDYSEDGKQLVTAGYDGRIGVWDVASGVRVHELAGHAVGMHLRAEWVPGNRLLSISDDGSVRLWDMASRRELHRFVHRDRVWSARFDADGRRLLTTCRDGSVAVWDVASGKQLVQTAVAAHQRLDAVFDPSQTDGVWIASGQGKLLVWNLRDPAREIVAEGPPLVGLVADRSQRRIGVMSENSVELWNAATETHVASLVLGDSIGRPVRPVRPQFSADGSTLALGVGSAVQVWDVAAHPLRRFVLKGHAGEVSAVAFDRHGARLASASVDGRVRLWDLGAGASAASFDALDHVLSLQFSHDDERLVTASFSGTVSIWRTPSEVRRLDRGTDRTELRRGALHPDGRRLLTVGVTGLTVLDLGGSQRARHESTSIVDARWSSDGSEAISITSGGLVQAHRAADLRPMEVIARGLGSLTSLEVRAGLIAVGSETGQLVVIGRDGAVVKTLQAHDGRSSASAFSRDGRQLATTGWDNRVRVWDVATWKPVRELALKGWGYSVSFDDSGTRLLVAARQQANIWDLASGQVLVSMSGHRRDVVSARFGSASLVITASIDGTSKVWDAGTGRLLASYELQDHGRWAAFDADGRDLVAVSSRDVLVYAVAAERRPLSQLEHVIRAVVPFTMRNGFLTPVHQ